MGLGSRFLNHSEVTYIREVTELSTCTTAGSVLRKASLVEENAMFKSEALYRDSDDGDEADEEEEFSEEKSSSCCACSSSLSSYSSSPCSVTSCSPPSQLLSLPLPAARRRGSYQTNTRSSLSNTLPGLMLLSRYK